MIIKDGAKMSKSKGNVVSPDELIRKYGADTVRLYTLFMGPPEKDAEWQDQGVEGAYRFLGRLWRLAQRLEGETKETIEGEALSQKEILFQLHRTIKKVTEDLEGNFHFNTAVSACMEFLNALYRFSARSSEEKKTFRLCFETLLVLLAPFIPYLAEELWSRLGHSGTIFHAKWPSYDPRFFEREEEEIVVQISGRVRSRLMVSREISEEEIKVLVLRDDKVKQWLDGKEVKKVIFVPHRLVNVVI